MKQILSTQDIAPLMKDLRRKAGLSQEELASFSGLSRTAVQRLERGEETIQMDTLFKILAILNIKVYLSHDLLTEEDNDA